MISRANRSRRICYNVTSTPVQPMARYARSGYDCPRLDHVLGKRPMSEQRPRVVAVGEALIEFVRGGDGNFRPRGWRGDLSRTRAVFMEALKRIDMALPAYDDEAVLWGDPSPEATVERLQAFGIAEIVVKNGPNSALVASGGRNEFIPVPEVVVPVDTTAAGDSFNAAYIAARMAGTGPAEAAAAAHRLAAQVIRHRGALMPRAAAAVH